MILKALGPAALVSDRPGRILFLSSPDEILISTLTSIIPPFSPEVKREEGEILSAIWYNKYMDVDVILQGDALEVLRTLPGESVNCCVTSPPYWGFRDYGIEGQLGLERTPEEYVEQLVAVFREVRRVLRDDGTLWLNLGDCYASPGKGGPWDEKRVQKNTGRVLYSQQANRGRYPGLKSKDLVGMPWRVAFCPSI